MTDKTFIFEQRPPRVEVIQYDGTVESAQQIVDLIKKEGRYSVGYKHTTQFDEREGIVNNFVLTGSIIFNGAEMASDRTGVTVGEWVGVDDQRRTVLLDLEHLRKFYQDVVQE